MEHSALRDNVDLVGNLTAAKVKIGGAVIDTNGFDVGLSQPLLHDMSLGGTLDGGLTKIGTGILTMTATSSYTGNTIVKAGTLEIAGGIPVGGTSLIDIQSGNASFKTVNVNKSNLHINTAQSATFEIEDGSHTVDAISGNGTTLIDSGASLTVASIWQDTLIMGSGATLNIQAIPGGLQGGRITPVPEPSTLVLLIIGAISLITYTRRRCFRTM